MAWFDAHDYLLVDIGARERIEDLRAHASTPVERDDVTAPGEVERPAERSRAAMDCPVWRALGATE